MSKVDFKFELPSAFLNLFDLTPIVNRYSCNNGHWCLCSLARTPSPLAWTWSRGNGRSSRKMVPSTKM